MAKKKSKGARAKARTPDPEIWAKPQFKALLDENACMTCEGLKLMVENQRDINTKLYQSIEATIKTILQDHPLRDKRGNPLAAALKLVQQVPGSGPPECKEDGPGGG